MNGHIDYQGARHIQLVTVPFLAPTRTKETGVEPHNRSVLSSRTISGQVPLLRNLRGESSSTAEEEVDELIPEPDRIKSESSEGPPSATEGPPSSTESPPSSTESPPSSAEDSSCCSSTISGTPLEVFLSS
ncbi:hypothetical protein FOZ60_005512 [Perkinsus olseni]|uniref:Uncharacterized protein n=1 Tax=Perkinsus olseni TaxID=32597 RepID=A0A7J6PH05_PEROL|nr:hypothetical protein FOZ60_005512 [Perkinsus olseni]